MAGRDEDRTWMRRGISPSHEGIVQPGRNRVGCVIVRDREVIGEGCNKVRHGATPTSKSFRYAMFCRTSSSTDSAVGRFEGNPLV
jgi:hypothetical protein